MMILNVSFFSFPSGKTGELLDTKFYDMWGGGRCSNTGQRETNVLFFFLLVQTPFAV